MNKKFLLVMLSIVLLGSVSGLLVNFYSNKVTIDFEMKHPIQLTMVSDNTNPYAGEVVNFNTTMENKLNESIFGCLEYTLTNPEGVNSSDFRTRIDSGSNGRFFPNKTDTLILSRPWVQVDNNTIVYNFCDAWFPMPKMFQPYEVQKYTFQLRFKPTAIGNYKLESEVVV